MGVRFLQIGYSFGALILEGRVSTNRVFVRSIDLEFRFAVNWVLRRSIDLEFKFTVNRVHLRIVNLKFPKKGNTANYLF